MPDQQAIIARRDPGGVELLWYARGGAIVARTVLQPRRALLLGLELANLAAEPVFRSDANKDPAGWGARPVNPPAL